MEIGWGLWGCGAELMCGDTLGAVGLRSTADASRMKGLEIAQNNDKFVPVHAVTAYRESRVTAPFILNFNS